MVLIRNIKADDSEKFLSMLKKLDKETKFMMYEPDERKTTITEMAQRINESISNSSFLMIAEDNFEIVGFLSADRGFANRIKHSAYVVVGILKEHSGQGIGTSLFNKLIEWADMNRISRLELTVMSNNEKAMNLYKKFGFEVEGVKKKSMKIDDKYIDEYYMARVEI
ncbi:MAG: putative acetyltransferase YhhY [Firmicutes bacterium ADurb.Bin419]|nr:MAG: putative acetyltransferase YhhY [Firmicutes bacterium ADurb.Bin419]